MVQIQPFRTAGSICNTAAYHQMTCKGTAPWEIGKPGEKGDDQEVIQFRSCPVSKV